MSYKVGIVLTNVHKRRGALRFLQIVHQIIKIIRRATPPHLAITGLDEPFSWWKKIINRK